MFFMFPPKVYKFTFSLCKVIAYFSDIPLEYNRNYFVYVYLFLHLSTRHHLEHFHRANDTDSNHNKWQQHQKP